MAKRFPTGHNCGAMKRAALLLSIALPAFADRFNVTFEGKSVGGAEVCATRAGDLASPVTRFLTGGVMTCHPAKGDVRLPPGTWNVFARSGADLISDDAVLAGDSKDHDLKLVRAARAEAGEATHVYVVATGTILPISGAAPATRVVPLAVAAGRIRAIGAPVTPEPGKPVRFELPPDPAEKGSVVVPVAKPSRAEVVLAGAKQRADSALLFFHGVPAGAQQIAYAGAQQTVNVEAGKVAVAAPLVERSALRIRWWAPAALDGLAKSRGACERSAPASGGATLELLHCPTNRCSVVGTSALRGDALTGVAELAGVAAGDYIVRVSGPGLPPFSANVSVPPNIVDLEIRYLTFSGKVTRGGKPLHVRLFGTVTDAESGEYTAVVTSLPKPPFALQPCSGGRAIALVPDDAPAENARYDIEVPENRLTIRVLDADSRAPLDNATVNMSALENDKLTAAHFAGTAGMTDAEGKLVIESAVTNKRLQICASRTDYENACFERFRLGSDREKTIDIALNKASVRQGRVVLPGPQQAASITWWSLDGRRTEAAQVREDGTFEFRRTHAAGEIVTYTAANQPFLAMRQPPLDPDAFFDIRPAIGARLRTFQVALSSGARENAFVTIALGDMIVPFDALMRHIEMHGAQSTLRPGDVTTVADVLESAPIRVILLPFSYVQMHNSTGGDFAMFPEVNTLPQQELGERARVEFR